MRSTSAAAWCVDATTTRSTSSEDAAAPGSFSMSARHSPGRVRSKVGGRQRRWGGQNGWGGGIRMRGRKTGVRDWTAEIVER
jgi:hypothetical protein